MKIESHNGFTRVLAARLVIVTFLAVISGSGCFGTAMQRLAQTQSNPSASMEQPFAIKGGETVVLDGGKLSVTFEEVKGDSRCPIDVTCIWEGDANVVLRLKKTDRAAEPIEIHTSSRFATEGAYEDYRVKLQELRPQARANTPIDQKTYSVTLVVFRV